MANYNFTVTNNSLKVELVITSGDFEPRIDTFKSPSFSIVKNKIKLFEHGIYKMALAFNEFGTIDGNTPTDLEDALDLLDVATANFSGGGASPLPYKVYTALLTQSGTDAPVATVLENTLGGDIVWTYEDVGYYFLNGTGLFNGNIVINTGIEKENDFYIISFPGNYTNDQLNIFTSLLSNIGNGNNDLLSNTSITIKIYN